MKPVITYIGNKRKAMPFIAATLPVQFGDYYEPFLGGGSVFYEIYKLSQGFFAEPRKFFLSDLNSGIINMHQALKADAYAVYQELMRHYKDGAHREEIRDPSRDHVLNYFKANKEYYTALNRPTKPRSSIERAADLIFMHHFSFRGLHTQTEGKIPSLGYHGVPNLKNMLEVGKSYQHASIRCCSFEDVHPTKGSFVFLDPPYYKTLDIYNQKQFDKQEAVRAFCDRCDKAGAYFMAFNSYDPFIVDLYKPYNIRSVSVPKHITKAKSAGNVHAKEALITNYA